MKKILITGATDGLGLVAAEMMAKDGYHLILHGRNPAKLEKAVRQISEVNKSTTVEGIECDLSDLKAVKKMAAELKVKHDHLDVLVNNAGILKSPETLTSDSLDIRFVVNTIAPFILVEELLEIMNADSRIVNLSSAAQRPVDINALSGKNTGLDDMEAYAQSKLAIILWAQHMVYSKIENLPTIISLNPGSLLGTKMVKEGFSMEGKDINIGGEIIMRCALEPAFQKASGRYFDNDQGNFGPLHADALDKEKCEAVYAAVKKLA